MRHDLGLTRPRAIHAQPSTEFELDGPWVRLTHTTIHGRCFEARAPRDAGRDELAAVCAMALHLAAEDAFELADEVLRRLGRAAVALR
jgi:hypothetical protein